MFLKNHISVIFSSYVGLELDGFFKWSNSRFSVPPSSFPIVLMKLHAQFSWPYPVSEFPKNGLDRILPLTLNRKLNLNGDLIDNWSLCSSSLDEYAPKDTSTDTSTLDSWVCCDSVKNSDGRVNGKSSQHLHCKKHCDVERLNFEFCSTKIHSDR